MSEDFIRYSFNEYTSGQIRNGLEAVRTGLMTGEISPKQFDMSRASGHCGTGMCIGGWLAATLGIPDVLVHKAVWDTDERPLTEHDVHELHALFWEWPQRHVITPEHGIQAITSWLSGHTQDPWVAVRSNLTKLEEEEELEELEENADGDDEKGSS